MERRRSRAPKRRSSIPQAADHDRRSALIRISTLSTAPLWPLLVLAEGASLLNALPRVALVIGNSRYQHLPPLLNPGNDANELGKLLKDIGFSVEPLLDAGKKAMLEAFGDYSARLSKDKGVGLFYFAGHGLQLRWRNYLVPVDAALQSSEDVAKNAIDLSSLLESVGRVRNAMNIVILDACRDNPFRSDLVTGKGLSQVDAPVGTLLAYATAPGNLASDGDRNNGLYTENLLKEMRAPGAKIEDVFKRVRLSVRRASGGRQIPWESTSLEDDFYFIPPAQVQKASKEERDRQFAEELAIWEKAEAKVATAVRSLRRSPAEAK
jgi:uncharacterized caspase-like protein